MLLAALPLAACTDQLVDPSAEPVVRVPPAPSLSFAPPVSGIVAAPAFGIPGSNTVNIGATSWFDIGYTVEEPGWVEMRTAGEVEWKVNPAGYTTGCGNWCVGSDVLPYYGEGTTGGAGLSGGELRSHLAAGETRPEAEYGAGQRTSPDGQVYALVRVEPGTRLWAARSGMGGVRSCAGSGSCGELSEGPTGWYLFESRMNVQVRKVIPIQVQPNRTAPGEALSWKAVVYEGVGELSWAYVSPGDVPLEVPCAGQTECVWQPPPYPGRMRVTGRWRGGSTTLEMVGYSDSVANQPAKLKLTCTSKLGENRVTRGDTINCTAIKDPETALGELKIGGWSFEGKPRTDGDVTSTEWRGVMVTGGTIRVRGTIGASPEETASAPISVEARTNWAGVIVYPATLPDTVFDPARFPNPPVRDSSGYDVYLPGGLGLYEFDLKWRGHLAPVTSGPNKDWWYLRTPPQWMTPVVYLSPYLEAGNPFYEAQTGKRTGDNAPPRGYTGWCTKSDMDVLKQEVLDHEGAISGPRLSHHEFNVAYTSRRDPGPVVEGVVFYLADQTASLQKVAELQIAQAYEAQMLAANTAAVHASSNTYTVPCKVHYP